jgi:hypothetical protein
MVFIDSVHNVSSEHFVGYVMDYLKLEIMFKFAFPGATDFINGYSINLA